MTWSANLGLEIDICGINFDVLLDGIENLDGGLTWLRWNFELFELFLELYVQS